MSATTLSHAKPSNPATGLPTAAVTEEDALRVVHCVPPFTRTNRDRHTMRTTGHDEDHRDIFILFMKNVLIKHYINIVCIQLDVYQYKKTQVHTIHIIIYWSVEPAGR